jgi:hypothetical protein
MPTGKLSLVPAVIAMVLLLPLLWCASSKAATEITIDNTRSASDLVYKVEGGIFAFRSLTNSPVNEAGIEPIAIPRDIVMHSVLSFDEISQAFSKSGLNEATVTMEELESLIARTSYHEGNLFAPYRPKLASFDELSVNSKPITMPGIIVPKDPIARELATLTFNASTITNLVAAGAFADMSSGFYVLGTEESHAIKYLTSNLYHLAAYRNDLAGEAFAELLNYVKRYDSLSKSFLAYVGRITFGLPIPARAEEIGLVLPNFIDQNFDVYWIELTATYREMADDAIEEMVFNITLPPDCVALELIPIRYGPREEVSVEQRSPELKVKVGNAEISVGEFFGKRVSYNVIRPTIIAYGKGENVISWSLHDEAVSAGSHNFVAIVGVPKRSTRLPLAMTAHVKTQGFFGVEGKLAGTEIEALELALPQ